MTTRTTRNSSRAAIGTQEQLNNGMDRRGTRETNNNNNPNNNNRANNDNNVNNNNNTNNDANNNNHRVPNSTSSPTLMSGAGATNNGFLDRTGGISLSGLNLGGNHQAPNTNGHANHQPLNANGNTNGHAQGVYNQQAIEGLIRSMWRTVEKVPVFSGATDEDVGHWIAQWDKLMEGTYFPNIELIKGLSSRLSDKASRWYHELPALNGGVPWTAATIITHMREKFLNDYTKAVNKMALKTLVSRGQGGKKVEAYYDEFIRKVRISDEMSEQTKVDFFIEGLREDIRRQIRLQSGVMGPNVTLETVVNNTRRLEMVFDEERHNINAIDADTHHQQHTAQSGSLQTPSYQEQHQNERVMESNDVVALKLSRLEAMMSDFQGQMYVYQCKVVCIGK